MTSALSVRAELSSRIVSMDPTGLPPMRRMGSSVAFVRRKRSGVITSASAEEMIGHNKEKNNPEIRTSLVDVEDSWRWLKIQVL
jgi:hypothetical protein